MKAMILAAGLGTRLRPLTGDRPKALVELNGRTLLEITITRLRQFGVTDIIVNVHHFADKVAEYLLDNQNFGLNIQLSREDDQLLDTGGGLKKAASFFDGSDEPFFLHNADVVSEIDLTRMLQAHEQKRALATLAVQQRESSRQLLFDKDSQLCGRRKQRGSKPEIVRPVELFEELAFCGIHVISPRMLPMLVERGVFSIVDAYLRLAAAGERIIAFRADQYYWRDLGRPEQLRQAEEDFRAGRL